MPEPTNWIHQSSKRLKEDGTLIDALTWKYHCVVDHAPVGSIWAAATKETKSCRTHGEFVCLYIYSFHWTFALWGSCPATHLTLISNKSGYGYR